MLLNDLPVISFIAAIEKTQMEGNLDSVDNHLFVGQVNWFISAGLDCSYRFIIE
jgi:hypothetical protein